MRKSPSAHEVEHHTRSTSTGSKVAVRKYHRGSGKPETPQIFSRVTDDDKSHGGFAVRLGYADGSSESGVVKSPDYLSALPKGISFAKKQVKSITLRKMEPWTKEVK